MRHAQRKKRMKEVKGYTERVNKSKRKEDGKAAASAPSEAAAAAVHGNCTAFSFQFSSHVDIS